MRQLLLLAVILVLSLGCATAKIRVPAHDNMPEVTIDATAFGQSTVSVTPEGVITVTGGAISDGIISGFVGLGQAFVSFFRGQPPVVNVIVPKYDPEGG